MDEKQLIKLIRVLTTHNESEDNYCDTGEDIEWCCRSECMVLAIKRLEVAYRSGYFKED